MGIVSTKASIRMAITAPGKEEISLFIQQLWLAFYEMTPPQAAYFIYKDVDILLI